MAGCGTPPIDSAVALVWAEWSSVPPRSVCLTKVYSRSKVLGPYTGLGRAQNLQDLCCCQGSFLDGQCQVSGLCQVGLSTSGIHAAGQGAPLIDTLR